MPLADLQSVENAFKIIQEFGTVSDMSLNLDKTECFRPNKKIVLVLRHRRAQKKVADETILFGIHKKITAARCFFQKSMFEFRAMEAFKNSYYNFLWSQRIFLMHFN